MLRLRYPAAARSAAPGVALKSASTRVANGLIGAAPLRREWSLGMLIEDVEKVEGMRGRRRWAAMGSRMDACVYGGPWMGPTGLSLARGVGLG